MSSGQQALEATEAVRLTSAQLGSCNTAIRLQCSSVFLPYQTRAKAPGLALMFTAIHVGLGQSESHIFDLVAVLTAWMAWNPIDPAAAATTGVPWAPRAPAWTLGDPADLSVADSTADPVTAVLLLHHNPALWAVHGLALLQHHPQHLGCLLGSHIIPSPMGQVILVLSAIHALVDGLAEQTIDAGAHRTGELVDVILKEAPASAVWGLAVVAQGASILCDGHTQVQETLVVLRGQERPDLPLQQLARA